MNAKSEFKSSPLLKFKQLLFLQATVLLFVTAANGQELDYQVLHSFSGSDGARPISGLVLSSNTLYGTTTGGGTFGFGTVFKMNIDGSGYAVLHNFTEADGASPEATLTLAGNVLYGTTPYTANSFGASMYGGTLFKLNVDGSGFVVLKQYTDTSNGGAAPKGGLVLSGTTLYGTTAVTSLFSGGASGDGTIFRVNTDGSDYALLKTFGGPDKGDAGGPWSTLMLEGDTLYGTTMQGGALPGRNNGTVFKIKTNGTGFVLLNSFAFTNGSDPDGTLVLLGKTLYGTTQWGGASDPAQDQGTVFRINTDGSGFSVLHSFSGEEGALICPNLVVCGNVLYGAATFTRLQGGGGDGSGTIFGVGIDGSGFTVLKTFNGAEGAGSKNVSLLFNGKLYGTTYQGGSWSKGVVFSLSVPPGPPAILTSPESQVVGIGSDPSFEVICDGNPEPAYQWYFNEVDAIRDATNAVLQLANVQLSDSGAYTVVVTNAYGAVTSAPAILTVVDAPWLQSSPTNMTVTLGHTAEFSVNVVGALPLVYQWYFNSTNEIAGATNSVLQVADVQFSQAGAYSVVIRNAFGSITSSPAMLGVIEETVVTGTTEVDLRAALNGGGKVIFACDGTITLTDTITNQHDTVLDGSGRDITISGGSGVRVIYNSTNANLTLINVTIANGSSSNGAGIFNDGGQLTLSQVVFQANIASAYDGGASQGGGIFNAGGTVNATNCSFQCNLATAVPAQFSLPLESRGGAILNASGAVHLENCVFTSNSVYGYIADSYSWYPSMYYPGTDGTGGAIHNSGTLVANNCIFSNNSACGGLGGDAIPPDYYSLGSPGGAGNGGAVFNSGFATVNKGIFSGNFCTGGAGGSSPVYDGAWGGSANGGAICNSGDLQVGSSAFSNNGVIGGAGANGGIGEWPSFGAPRSNAGGAGGSGNGGAICNSGSLLVANSTIANNSCTGAPGGDAGPGGGVIVLDGTEAATASNGGSGGAGNGGVLFNSGTAVLVNDTLAFNTGKGMQGGHGGNGSSSSVHGCSGGNGGNGGNGGPGFACIYGPVYMTNCTVAFNSGFGGVGGGGGAGGAGGPGTEPPGAPGVLGDPGTNGTATGALSGGLVVNVILSGNMPSNCSSTITDAGHNLSSDNSCAFTAAGSLNNTDPMLGPLADNGGPTLTMALLPGSPAIDAGDDTAAPPTDQRGFPRPVGAASDIGAYECNPPQIATLSPDQTAEWESSVDFAVGTFGDPATGYLWFFNATNLVASSTNPDVVLTNLRFSESGNYTVVVTNAFGSVTSAPIMLNIIPAVERRPVPAINLTGDAGSSLNVDYANSLTSPPNWLPLDTVNLTNTSQFCVDLTSPMPAQRFYRAWQSGTPSVTPSLDLHFLPAILLTGNIGETQRLDYINAIGPTDAWVTLDTVTLTNTSQLYFDTSSIGQPRRLYRIAPVP